MKNENDVWMMKNIIKDLGYTGREDRDSERKTFFTITLPKLIDETQNGTIDESTQRIQWFTRRSIKNYYTI